jgi:hypothetical protein
MSRAPEPSPEIVQVWWIYAPLVAFAAALSLGDGSAFFLFIMFSRSAIHV